MVRMQRWFWSTAFLVATAQADVKFLHSIDLLGAKIKEPVALHVGSDSRISVFDRDSGQQIIWQEGVAPSIVKLAGKTAPLPTEKISGYTVLADGKTVFSSDSEDVAYVLELGGQKPLVIGADDGLNDPAAVFASASNRLYFADRGNDRVAVFTVDGVFLFAFGHEALDDKVKLNSPFAIAVDGKEQSYVLDRDGRLSIFAPDGRLLKQIDEKSWPFANGKAVSVSAMTVDRAGMLYVADHSNQKIVQFDWQQNQVRENFGSRGKGRGQFENVTALSVAENAVLVVLDNNNRKIEAYQLGQPIPAIAPLRLPRVLNLSSQKHTCSIVRLNVRGDKLCLDVKQKKLLHTTASGGAQELAINTAKIKALRSDEFYRYVIEDAAVSVFDNTGKAVVQLAKSGKEDGAFRSPRSAVISEGRLFVADTGNDRVQAFTLDGLFVKKTSDDEKQNGFVHEPSVIVADDKGSLFVVDGEKQRINVYNRELEFQYRIGAEAGALQDVIDLAVDSDNFLYALVKYRDAFGVRVYNGKEPVLRFGRTGETGNDLLKPTQLSVVGGDKPVVYIQDEKRGALLAFGIYSVPGPVAGVKVQGTDEGTRLHWQRAPEHFVTQYRVYGAAENGSQKQLLAEVKTTETLIEQGKNQSGYFAITAVSGFGAESDVSAWWPDEYSAGKRLFEAGQFSDAEKWFARSVAEQSSNADALRMWGVSLLQQQKLDEALSKFDALAAMPNQRDRATQLKLQTLTQAKRFLEARALLDTVLVQKPNDITAWWICSEINLQLNDLVGAISCLEEVLKRDPKHSEALLALGKTYIQAGAVDQGLSYLERAKKQAPQDAFVSLTLAQQLAAATRHTEALALFAELAQHSKWGKHAKLGMAQIQFAQHELALAKSTALSLSIDAEVGTEATLMLGHIALVQQQPQEALLAYGRLLRGENKPAAALLGMANVYGILQQPDKELASLRDAAKATDADVSVFQQLGNRELAAKNGEAAVVALDHALRLSPRSVPVLTDAVKAHLFVGHTMQARDLMQLILQINSTDPDLFLLSAQVSQKQGKLLEGIEQVKRAQKLAADRLDIQLLLAGLYFDTGQYELAEPVLTKIEAVRHDWAPAYVLRAKLFAANLLFDKAIPAAEKAVALEASDENRSLLNSLLAGRKQGQDAKLTAQSLTLENLQLKPIFSAAYKIYAKQSIGTVTLRNAGNAIQNKLRVRFDIKGFMDFPFTHDVDTLAANESIDIPLFATFNNRILQVDEDTGVQAEVAVSQQSNAHQTLQQFARPTTLYGKNAILWSNSDMVGAFVTPRDEVLRDFVRQTVNSHLPKAKSVNKNLLLAMTYFSSLTAQGLRYQPDPNAPFSKLAEDQIDYVQFPRETLRLRSGDCDDLSVLLAAGLENLGVQTMLVDVPGHLFLAFDSGVSMAERDTISLDPDLVLDRDGQAWLPLEATMIATTFSEAWVEGARKFKVNREKNNVRVLPLRDAWQISPPVTLPSAEAVTVPDAVRIEGLVGREHDYLLAKSVERLTEPYRIMAMLGQDPHLMQLQIGIQYAKAGLHEKALQHFDQLLAKAPQMVAAHVAMGNVHYLRRNYRRALDAYNVAERLAPDDAGIRVNVALSFYGLQQFPEALAKYREAVVMQPDLAKKYEALGKLLSN